MIFAGNLVAIKGVLAGAITTSQLPITGGYAETTQAGVMAAIAQIHTVTNSTTNVTIVAATGTANNRKLQGLSIVNIDTVAATFTLFADDGTNTRTILKVTLEVGDQLTIADDGSWAVKDLNGDIHTSGSAPSDADYLVKTANGNLSAERVVTDTATIIADWGTPGQAKLNVAGATTLYGALDALTVTGANVASATTTDIGAATGESITITGTTTITGLGTKASGCLRFCTFSGALILTHNGTSLILPTAANITTAAGDTALFVSLGSGNWKCLNYTRASGAALASSGVNNTIILEDQKASGTDGGTFTSGAWRTRVLNTEVIDTGGDCSLSSNQFTLTAGTYEIYAIAPTYSTGRHQIRLQNVTDATTIASGSSMLSPGGAYYYTSSTLICRFTVAASKALEIQHQCDTTSATYGFGVACGLSFSVGNETYAQVMLRRVA